jgi:hypothetical protein
MTAHIDTYLDLMHEVKRRHLSLQNAFNEPHRLTFKAVVVDHCYLQLRNILELIAFSVLSANQHALTALQQGKTRDYHAEKVLRSIERKFGAVYPRPIYQHMDSRPGVRADFIDLTEGFLTRAEFAALYDECGNVLHGRNPFRKPLNLDYYWPRIPEWSGKIRTLLNSHIATIVNDPYMHLIQMGAGDDRPSVWTFARLG